MRHEIVLATGGSRDQKLTKSDVPMSAKPATTARLDRRLRRYISSGSTPKT